MCPGCRRAHHVWVGRDEHPVWWFNGDGGKPTFQPSILLSATYAEPPVTAENLDEWHRAPWPQVKVKMICHFFVTDGRIQFLSDSTHELAGQTVDLPDWEER